MESLIAIIIGGIACIALLSLMITVIREEKNNEIRDALTYYAADGMAQLRVVAKNQYTQIYHDDSGTLRGVCDNGQLTYGYFEEGRSRNDPLILPDTSSGVPDRITQSEEGTLCSNEGNECETLALPTGGRKLFYREIKFEPIALSGPACNLVRVTVRVGMIDNGTYGSQEYARNFETELELTGLITK